MHKLEKGHLREIFPASKNGMKFVKQLEKRG